MPIKGEVRVNDQIRVPEVRVIDPDGKQIGIMGVREALRIAQDYGLDLVEVSPGATPPVCRIMDYGKYKYEQSKKLRKAKKKQHVVHLKEIQMRPKIDEHDYQFKLRHIRNFLEHKDRVKVTVEFRGRENVHRELGEQILNRVISDLKDVAAVEGSVRSESRSISIVFVPKS